MKIIPKNDNLPLTEVKEEKMNCPICGLPSACMVEHTITREETKPPSENMNESLLSSYLCMSCGFTSNSNLKLGSEILKIAISNSPKLVTDLAIPDHERTLAWFPVVLNIPNKGVIYPDGTLDMWEWVVAPYEQLSAEELSKYTNEGEALPKYTHRLAIEKSKKFPKDGFQLALSEIKDILLGENQ